MSTNHVTVPKMGRSWCLTFYNEEDVHRLDGMKDVRALVVGREICPTTKRVHWQSYVRFEAPKRFSWWKNQFPTVHVELRKGSEQEAADYCREDGEVLIDRGTQIPEVEYKGDVTEHVCDMMEQGAQDYEVYRAHRKFFFHNCSKVDAVRSKMDEWDKRGKRYKKDDI